MKRLALIALALLVAAAADAGRLTGRVAANAPSALDACDSLGIAQSVPHKLHARLMAGADKVWEDSLQVSPGSPWTLYYPELGPGTYQAVSWTTKATNGMVGCPDILNFTVSPKYEIIFGWATIGAIWSTEDQRVIGMAEMLRRLRSCDSLQALRP